MESDAVDCTATSSTTTCPSLSVSASSNHTPISTVDVPTPSPNSCHATTSREDMDCQENSHTRPQRNTSASKRDVANEVRHKRRKSRPGDSGCPVCGLTIRAGEMDAHLTQELDKLSRLPQSRPLSQRAPTASPAPASSSSTPSSSSSSSSSEGAAATTLTRARQPVGSQGRGTGWETYQRVKNNRQVRVRVKRRRVGGQDGDVTCPVCGKWASADDSDDIHSHIDECLRRVEDEDVEVEDEGDVEYEEYTWCGQTRVRATQMLRAEGQLHALGTKVERGSEDELVEVCDDADNDTYGPSQYTDGDLSGHGFHTDSDSDPGLPNNHDATSSDRKNTTPSYDGLDVCDASTTLSTSSSSHVDGLCPTSSGVGNEEGGSSSSSSNGGGAVVEALRARVLELEHTTTRGRYTCRVCHGEYETPLVSVVCWHVHCEQCWLPALAAKKLCPQCSVITGPSDLRRVYL